MSESGSPFFSKKFPSPETIGNDLRTHGFRVYDNAIQPSVIEKLREFWIPYFKAARAAKPERETLRGNLRLGEKNFNSFSDNREWYLYRDFDFLWNEPTHALTREVSTAIHMERNKVLGFPEDRGLKFSPDKYGMYISTSNYPAGQGHMREHIDAHSDPSVLHYHYMLPLTFKGQDYSGGGLTVRNKMNEKVNLDDLCKPGSIIFYDGVLKHGVEAIEGSEDSMGRIATFAVPIFFTNQDEFPDALRKIAGLYNGINHRFLKR